MRTYSELILFPTFDERFEYLRLDGEVGKITFGYERYLNQLLYNSGEWKRIRQITRLPEKVSPPDRGGES